MAEEKITKVKKKRWIQVLAPALFNNEVIGEIPVTEPNSLVNRAVTVNLMTLTRDMKKQNTSLKLIIKSVKGDKVITDMYGYYLSATSIRRLVRRGKEKIGLTVICKTADNKKIRIMPLIIPFNKVKSSVSAAFKKSASNYIISYISKTTFENIIKDLITSKLQRDIKTSLKKIYPIRILEVAKMHIEKDKKPVEQEIELKEDIKEEPEGSAEGESEEGTAEKEESSEEQIEEKEDLSEEDQEESEEVEEEPKEKSKK